MPQVYVNKYQDPVVLMAPTLANLKLNQGGLDSASKDIAVLFGNAAAFDQAIKLYVWDPASEAGNNDTTVIQPTAVTGPGRWRAP